jgi:hypothetical protein
MAQLTPRTWYLVGVGLMISAVAMASVAFGPGSYGSGFGGESLEQPATAIMRTSFFIGFTPGSGCPTGTPWLHRCPSSSNEAH